MITIPSRLFTAAEFAAHDTENVRGEHIGGVLTLAPPAFTDHG